MAGFFFGDDAVRGEVSGQIKGMLGEDGAKGVETMLAGASKPQEGVLATIFGIGALIFAAVGVVVQLKDALNTVWEVELEGSGVWHFIRSYLISFAGVLSLGFLLLVSLLFTAALSAVGKFLNPYLPEAVMHIVGVLISVGFISLLFAMMFKWLPDAPVSWRDVWPAAVLTAILFEIGKFAIGLYIGKQGLESTYGAAASLVVILIWVYYTAQIVLMGAELSRVYAQRYGSLKDGTKPGEKRRKTAQIPAPA